MTTTTYNKSLVTDFNGSLDINQLKQEIIDDVTITTEHYGMLTQGDNVALYFSGSLSAGEQIALNSVIAAHSPIIEVAYNQTHTAYARKDFYNATSYKNISTYIYEGSKKMGDIKDIACVAYIDSDVTDFSIRIYDDTNNKVISEKTFTNTDRDSLSMLPLSNVPTKKAIITVQIKKSGGTNKKYVYIENIQFRI